MFWADRIAKKIIKSGKYRPFWVDDMKTPSGRIHVGSLRGVITHDLIYKTLLDQGVKTAFSYVIDDHDPMDGLPVYLDQKKYQKFMGQPLNTIPSPEAGFDSYAQYFARDFIEVFNGCGCHPKIIWASRLYKSGEMNEGIKKVLDAAPKIRKIYRKIADSEKGADWYPFQVICPKCGKVGTTKVTDWDGQKVTFKCLPTLVDWAQGCGYEGKTTPFNGTGKLPWKVEWAVKWQAIGITVEGAGKDHMSKGGSHDISSAICKEILEYPVPFSFSHEFFLIGGQKMSSSKGLGSSAREMYNLLPPQILRFLIIRPRYNQAINFNPDSLTIPDLFDEYDFCAQEYFKKSDGSDFGRIYELSQVAPISKKEPFLPRFRDIANYIQLPSVDIYEKFAAIKGEKLTKEEKKILKERMKYAQIWLNTHAPKELVYQVTRDTPEEAKSLSNEQTSYLKNLAKVLKQKDWKPERLQTKLYDLAKKLQIPSKKAFQAIYLALLGKAHGPKAAWFILDQEKDFIIKRFKKAAVFTPEKKEKKHLYPLLKRRNLFSIDKKVKKRFPSITVGLAIIKGVNIKKENQRLQKEITEFLESQKGLTTRKLGQYKEIKSYRRIYKETGIDWHSRRPSPEALLRRVALGKDLYAINACVDAYNLIVMKNRVSAGAFDLDKIKFPTVLRFSKKGEKILLLRDKKPTKYQEGEVAYFDQVGGYNIDFNYRDAQRTIVTEKTKNLWINTEGVYDISRNQVEETLKKVTEIITRYCGGELELAGIVKS